MTYRRLLRVYACRTQQNKVSKETHFLSVAMGKQMGETQVQLALSIARGFAHELLLVTSHFPTPWSFSQMLMKLPTS